MSRNQKLFIIDGRGRLKDGQVLVLHREPVLSYEHGGLRGIEKDPSW